MLMFMYSIMLYNVTHRQNYASTCFRIPCTRMHKASHMQGERNSSKTELLSVVAHSLGTKPPKHLPRSQWLPPTQPANQGPKCFCRPVQTGGPAYFCENDFGYIWDLRGTMNSIIIIIVVIIIIIIIVVVIVIVIVMVVNAPLFWHHSYHSIQTTMVSGEVRLIPQ